MDALSSSVSCGEAEDDGSNVNTSSCSDLSQSRGEHGASSDLSRSRDAPVPSSDLARSRGPCEDDEDSCRHEQQARGAEGLQSTPVLVKRPAGHHMSNDEYQEFRKAHSDHADKMRKDGVKR